MEGELGRCLPVVDLRFSLAYICELRRLTNQPVATASKRSTRLEAAEAQSGVGKLLASQNAFLWTPRHIRSLLTPLFPHRAGRRNFRYRHSLTSATACHVLMDCTEYTKYKLRIGTLKTVYEMSLCRYITRTLLVYT